MSRGEFQLRMGLTRVFDYYRTKLNFSSAHNIHKPVAGSLKYLEWFRQDLLCLVFSATWY